MYIVGAPEALEGHGGLELAGLVVQIDHGEEFWQLQVAVHEAEVQDLVLDPGVVGVGLVAVRRLDVRDQTDTLNDLDDFNFQEVQNTNHILC